MNIKYSDDTYMYIKLSFKFQSVMLFTKCFQIIIKLCLLTPVGNIQMEDGIDVCRLRRQSHWSARKSDNSISQLQGQTPKT